MALCNTEAFTDTLPIVNVMALCMEAFTDTLPIVRNGFMYGSIYRHFTNSA